MASPPSPPNTSGMATSTATCMLQHTITQHTPHTHTPHTHSTVRNYLSCVFPRPGAPQISVILPTGTPPPSIESTYTHTQHKSHYTLKYRYAIPERRK